MSEQEQCTPVWHAIVGEGWRPVQIGDTALASDDVLRAGGWVRANDGGKFIYQPNMIPRRRRQRSYDVLAMHDGVNFCRVKAAKPGQCFMLTNNGELIPVEVER